MRALSLICVWLVCAGCATTNRQTGNSAEAHSDLVELKLTISQSGDVTHVEVYRSDAPELLQQSAIASVKKWRFKPASKDGIPVESYVIVPVRYKLSDETH